MTTRRRFLGAAAAAALPAATARPASNLSIGIAGAGLAGLACADRLRKLGFAATLYEAAARPGGRVSSLRGFFPGQTAELGGEFIDTAHKTMLGYAKEFKLTLEDVNKQPGDVFYFVNNQVYSEAEVVRELRAFVPAMREDLARLSNLVDAANPSPDDVLLDNTSLAEYLETRGAGPILKGILQGAYIGEYGRELAEQSSLNFLLFIRADRRAKFDPFAASDERYHIVEGNDAIASHLAARLAGQIQYGRVLSAVRKTPAGRIELTFASGPAAVHDVVVLAIPFSVLRGVALDSSLGLAPAKIAAIQNLGYGTNAKLMAGFDARPWQAFGGNGSSYANLAELQGTWETNPALATSTRAVITDYTGGNLGATLNAGPLQTKVDLFLTEFDKLYPGAKAAASQPGGLYRAASFHWPSFAFAKGSYTCYLPGQFTTIAGHEASPAGNLYFAGEHANSFYEYQGFMEGAALSGIDAATAIWKRYR